MTVFDPNIGDISDLVLANRLQVADTTWNIGTATGTSLALTGAASAASVSAPLVSATGANGQLIKIGVLEELTTIAASATTSTAIQIPAGSVVLAVSVRVTVTIPTAATMTVGDGTTAAKFNTGSNIAVAAGTTDTGMKAGPTYYAAATSIVFTPSLTPGTNAGRVRTTIFYMQVTPATA